ncbi:MAG: hypothetical protein ACO24U_07045 [Prochlorococcaceae cyanobacterium]
MQRTYLAPMALAAATALGAALGAPLLANTVPSRAPLGQGQPSGTAELGGPEAERLLNLAFGALQPTLQVPPPPPPLAGPATSETAGIVALEVVPYQPSPSDS